jgi:hypothetical protein
MTGVSASTGMSNDHGSSNQSISSNCTTEIEYRILGLNDINFNVDMLKPQDSLGKVNDAKTKLNTQQTDDKAYSDAQKTKNDTFKDDFKGQVASTKHDITNATSTDKDDCSNTDGKVFLTTEKCKCGTSTCKEGEKCNSSANKCNAPPDCSNTDGSEKITVAYCKCSTNICKKGLKCNTSSVGKDFTKAGITHCEGLDKGLVDKEKQNMKTASTNSLADNAAEKAKADALDTKTKTNEKTIKDKLTYTKNANCDPQLCGFLDMIDKFKAGSIKDGDKYLGSQLRILAKPIFILPEIRDWLNDNNYSVEKIITEYKKQSLDAMLNSLNTEMDKMADNYTKIKMSLQDYDSQNKLIDEKVNLSQVKANQEAQKELNNVTNSITDQTSDFLKNFDELNKISNTYIFETTCGILHKKCEQRITIGMGTEKGKLSASYSDEDTPNADII